MSFLSSMQQYVTSGISSLGLGNRRFSLSRQESSDPTGNVPNANATNTAANVLHTNTASFTANTATPNFPSGGVVIGNPNSSNPLLGYPKVVPTPGTSSASSTPLGQRRQSRALEVMTAPRTGSFRQRSSVLHQQETARAPLEFFKRRLSWPEVDPRSTSNVQETDGSFFENFTSLGWKRENRRMSATRAVEARAEANPENEHESQSVDLVLEQQEAKEKLYVEVLSTISNTVGAPVQGTTYAHFKDDMYAYAQRAFGIQPDQHYRLLNMAAEEKSKIVVLSVIVIEADGLEAKDANGFSDPYCMLGIQPDGGPPMSPLPLPPTPRALSADMSVYDGGSSLSVAGMPPPTAGGMSGDVTPHRKHSFRLSFKRRDGGRGREHRDSLGGPVPAKFIRATTIKQHTLCPQWNEKFKFDIDDINTDTFHLDIWDHDDESCVMDAVSRLNEVRGVRGLGRFFKQVCQSARQGSQDDFLGCVNIPVCEIPSSGIDSWFKLEARSQRSTVQGRIHLKMWLSTREDEGTSEEDTDHLITKYEKINLLVMQHEAQQYEPSWTWSGELPGPALSILHQLSVQADFNDFQIAMARFVSAAKLNRSMPLDPKFLHRLLTEVESNWNQIMPDNPPSHDIEQWLAAGFTSFLDHSLHQIGRHREIFPALHSPSLVRLELLLRCLCLLGTMRTFRSVCPFSKGVRGEVVNALRKGSIAWAKNVFRESQNPKLSNGLAHFVSTLSADIQLGQAYYHSLFDNTNGIQYFSIVYKQFDAYIGEEIHQCFENGQIPMPIFTAPSGSSCRDDKEIDPKPFELYLAIQEFYQLKRFLSTQPQPPEKPLSLAISHQWFLPCFERYMVQSKFKGIQRIRAALRLDAICEGQRVVRYSSSAIDTAATLINIKEFWQVCAWPDLTTVVALETQLIDVVCTISSTYSELLHQQLQDKGYYEQTGPFRCNDNMCVTLNNLEYVRRTLSDFRVNDQSLSDNAEHQLESTLSQMEARCERVLMKMASQMQMSLQKAVFHLAWSPDSLPANQALVPLLEYLDCHLAALNSTLLTKNFNRALSIVWRSVLAEISRQMETGDDSDKPSNFHKRLYEALQLLLDFFHAEGRGLMKENLHTDDFWHIEQRLQFHKTETEQLIDMFYMNRLRNQLAACLPGPYGSLAVRAYFNHDSLCVEVLHARDIVPLDPNGFSDPFVIIELLPRRMFPNCMQQQTNVHKRTLNPIFDECFEFPVSLEQCLREGAMICFTVMDHDVLTANDFGGEAFLALSTIPGVADYNTSVDNFHGLKHIELPLMQQNDKRKIDPILQILELRTNDKLAQEFVRKQKSRFIS